MLLDMQELQLPQIISAIGGLGTAAFGVLDALKPVIPYINRIGYQRIRERVSALLPEGGEAGMLMNTLTRQEILEAVHGNWINGVDLKEQIDAAKTLVLQHLAEKNAPQVALFCNIDPVALTGIARNLACGTEPEGELKEVYRRFDQILTALLEEVYQKSDHDFRNGTRALAAVLSVLLAVTGGALLAHGKPYWTTCDFGLALLAGLLATPLAPIAKDLSTALATAVTTVSALKKKS